jgi:hypothetical protein
MAQASTTQHGSPAAAGTRDTKVQRIEEGVPGLATVENPTANPPSMATFDAGLAAGGEYSGAQAQLDTSEYSGLTRDEALKRMKPSAF